MAQAMPVREREQRPKIAAGQIRRPHGPAERPGPPGPGGEDETVLEELAFRELQPAQRQGDDDRVEMAGEKLGDERFAAILHGVDRDPGR